MKGLKVLMGALGSPGGCKGCYRKPCWSKGGSDWVARDCMDQRCLKASEGVAGVFVATVGGYGGRCLNAWFRRDSTWNQCKTWHESTWDVGQGARKCSRAHTSTLAFDANGRTCDE